MEYEIYTDGSYESLESKSPSPPVIYYENIPNHYPVEIGMSSHLSPCTTSSGFNPNEQARKIQRLSLKQAINVSPAEVPVISSEHCSEGSMQLDFKIDTFKNPVSEITEVSSIQSIDHLIPLPISTLVFFDLETTGLGREIGDSNVHITELSMVAVAQEDFEKSQFSDLRDIRIVNKISICIKPRTKVSPGAAKITGLDNTKLLNQRPFDAGTAHMINVFLTRLPSPVCLLAHNGNNFDFPLLKAEFKRLEMCPPVDIYTADTLLAFRTFNIFETNTSASSKRKGAAKFKPCSLQNLYMHFFRKKITNSHSSEGDCKALMMVCYKVKDQFLPWLDENKSLFSSVIPMW